MSYEQLHNDVVNWRYSAIMKYHSLKMEEVNDTMRHLWSKTYQGTGTLQSFTYSDCHRTYISSCPKISTESKFDPTSKAAPRKDRTIIEFVVAFIIRPEIDGAGRW